MKAKRTISMAVPIILVGIMMVAINHQKSTSARRNETGRLKNLAQQAGRSQPGDFLSSIGKLWEPGATDAREKSRASLPLERNVFAAAVGAAPGSLVTLKLSDRIPVLVGKVTQSSVHPDGTLFTCLEIAGNPKGTLILQENAASGFFLGQLYYDSLPVAYEFKYSGTGLMAKRHALSDLICSKILPDGTIIESVGIPPVDKLKAKKADEQEAAAKIAIQQAKSSGGTTTIPAILIADAMVTEGNSGSSQLRFTVSLTKADRSKTITARFTSSNGTAIAGEDYTAISGTVTFPPRSTSQTIAVSVAGDSLTEPDETLNLTLTSPVNATIADGIAIGTITNDDSSAPVSNVPSHNSLPGAVAVAYLDMNGQTVSGTSWLNGGTIVAGGISNTFTQAQMSEIWRRIAEDYSPFQINVTTDESVFLAAPSNRRIRCIITPDNEWFGSAGGVAYLNSFTWTGDTPCWVFSDMLSNSPRYIAEAASHEIGHTLSLRHDGRTNPVEGYYTGHGSGEVGWAPIMGVGYYKSLVQWSGGEYLDADNKEDDLALITSLNGFGYRPDQVADGISGATPLNASGTARSASGILETSGDVDTFSMATTGGLVNFAVAGDSTSQNLDLQIRLLDSAGTALATDNSDLLTDASVSMSLPAGTYYLEVSGIGRGSALSDGYTDYASIGQYSLSGTAP